MKFMDKVWARCVEACENAEDAFSNPRYKMMCRVYANMFREKLPKNDNQKKPDTNQIL